MKFVTQNCFLNCQRKLSFTIVKIYLHIRRFFLSKQNKTNLKQMLNFKKDFIDFVSFQQTYYVKIFHLRQQN